MTDFGFWQNEANKRGLIMCVLCFHSKPVRAMRKLKGGCIWNVCQECWDREQAEIRRRETDGSG